MDTPLYRFPYFAGSRVHLGLTGSVAAYKSLDLCRSLIQADIAVSASLTEAGSRFVTETSLRALGADPVGSSLFTQEEVFPHLRPAQQCDALLVAPATANFLAKMSWGMANDLLSCQVLAFPGPVLVAPAMNPNMWKASATQSNVSVLRQRGIPVLQPLSGDVACGETGEGRLPPLEEIYLHLLRALAPQDMQGSSVLVTLGPTQEYFDPVRFWSNPSSGKMGAAIATAAWLRGADVHCVCGPSDVYLPAEVKQYPVLSARQMYSICHELWPGMNIACLCAAVCDLRPAGFQREKFKKEGIQNGQIQIPFSENPDILLSLGRNKEKGQKLVGFAAENEATLESSARKKLETKNLDLIVANSVDVEDSGFASDKNTVLLLDGHSGSSSLISSAKSDIGWRIWDWILPN